MKLKFLQCFAGVNGFFCTQHTFLQILGNPGHINGRCCIQQADGSGSAPDFSGKNPFENDGIFPGSAALDFFQRIGFMNQQFRLNIVGGDGAGPDFRDPGRAGTGDFIEPVIAVDDHGPSGAQVHQGPGVEPGQ